MCQHHPYQRDCEIDRRIYVRIRKSPRLTGLGPAGISTPSPTSPPARPPSPTIILPRNAREVYFLRNTCTRRRVASRLDCAARRSIAQGRFDRRVRSWRRSLRSRQRETQWPGSRRASGRRMGTVLVNSP